MQIRNTVNPADDLTKIYWDAVHEVDPARLIPSRVKKHGRTLTISGQGETISEDLSQYNQVVVLGIGKASARMASALEKILGGELSGGCVITKYGHGLRLEKIQIMEAGHPVPDENSVAGARALAAIAAAADKRTLIVNLISGGGSALFCLPADGISDEDKKETTKILLASGAAIDEMNCVRKHLSKVKGGRLAEIAYPARLINLILSDVMGDKIDAIASGIAVPDPTTFNDALSILEKYAIGDRLPRAVSDRLHRGAQGNIPETPKKDCPAFGNTVNIILGNNALACAAAEQSARRRGCDARIISTTLAGEASRAGADFASMGKQIAAGRSEWTKPAAIIAGGETTVTIRGKGKGGRCQEMALAFAVELHRLCPGARNIFFLAAGTDGTDGPTDAAGAVVTPELMEKMQRISDQAAVHLAQNDAYPFFEQTGHLFMTGPTYTNVCDIQVLIVT